MLASFIVELIFGFFFEAGTLSTFQVMRSYIKRLLQFRGGEQLQKRMVEIFTASYFICICLLVLVVAIIMPDFLRYDNFLLLIMVMLLLSANSARVFRLVMWVNGFLLVGSMLWQQPLELKEVFIFYLSSALIFIVSRVFLRCTTHSKWIGAVIGGLAYWLLNGLVYHTSFSTTAYSILLYLILILPIYLGLYYTRQLKNTFSQEKYLATYDEMTAAKNYRTFKKDFEGEVAAAAKGQPLTLIMIDIDCFKTINDSYGHLVGNDVLRSVSEQLIKNAAQYGAEKNVYRLGGEEFGIFLTDKTFKETQEIAQDCHDTIGALARSLWSKVKFQ
ncbi:diguanylate cyclase [Ligilactobacillus salitolerans]|uniref:Diguanylate cyclase n=2 Tax=Ligilactobacillus salitolerans TaxID=1808352 RepID=A0A401IUV5_9LACO|nr:diguanylate cyclase [Ligilactobacillus salitolerans]